MSGKRIANLSAKVTPEEEAIIHRLAIAHHESVSDFVRNACLRRIKECQLFFEQIRPAFEDTPGIPINTVVPTEGSDVE
jgi:hypothetical protein